MAVKTLKVNKKGMITIPIEIREKFNIKEGSEVSVMVINGEIQIIPIIDFDELRKESPTLEEMKKSYEESRAEEMEFEK